MRRIRTMACTLALSILVPGLAAAYPISPKPLWSLVAEADLVVVAEVADIRTIARDEDSWDSAIAHLQVVETLKGPTKRSVRVRHAAGLTCPAPARYAKGETVVAFLARERGVWRTVALSYGTLYPRGEDLQDMTAMIRAALVIQRTVSASSGLEQEKLEWLVQAAALPGTRWHGLYELEPAADRIRSYYDRTGRPDRLRVSKPQQVLLAEAFVEAPRFDPTLAMMLDALHGFESERVDAFALGVMEGLLKLEKPPYWMADVLRAVLQRFGDADPEAWFQEIEMTCSRATPEQARSIWTQAKASLALPEAPPVEIDLGEILPVGGRASGL